MLISIQSSFDEPHVYLPRTRAAPERKLESDTYAFVESKKAEAYSLKRQGFIGFQHSTMHVVQ